MAAGFKTATVTSAKVAASLSAYPAYVDLSRVGITTLAEAQSVRVYSDEAKTTELAREIVSVSEMHVKIPTLTTTTEIYVDWDGVRSDYATTATFGAEAVWVGYDLVSHDAGTTDSSGSHTGTGNGGITAGGATGKIGDATTFDGVDDYIDWGAFYTAEVNNFKFSAWLKATAFTGQGTTGNDARGVASQKNNGSEANGAWDILAPIAGGSFDAYQMRVYSGINAGPLTQTSSYTTTGTWHRIAMTADGTNLKSFLNGAADGSFATSNKPGTSQENLKVGFRGENGVAKYWYGDMCQVRISDNANHQSADWETTEYNNQDDEAAFWGTWTTVTLSAPTVTTQAVSSIGDTTATGNGNVTADGGATITERGVCWSTTSGPTTADSTATAAGTTGAFTASMTGLTASTTYYVRAYAINSEGTSYGGEETFDTLAAAVAPTVTTQAVSSITDTTATGNGNVTSDGGATITERGVCWSTSVTPTTADSTATDAGTTGAFTASITGLTASTTYYVRAYAINAEGTSYGSQVTFDTLATPTAPTVTTEAVSLITDTTATGNGTVTSDGGSTVTERGVCWSTSVTPTTADSTATSAGTTGAFTASITGLTASTTYYVRAYAINAEGTSYGSQVDFTTTATPSTPEVGKRLKAKYWDGSAWVRLS